MNALKAALLTAAKMTLLAAVGFTVLATLVSGLGPELSGRNTPSDDLPVVRQVASSDRQTGVLLNQLRRDRLSDEGLTTAELAPWLTVCRRLSLALVGTGVSLEEIRSLQRLSEADRVAVHRERLLGDSRHHDYWAERLTRMWVGNDEGPFLVYRRRKFRTWISDQLAKNVAYDDLVRRLITAEGLWTDRPETNFYTVTFDSGDDGPDPVRMAARVSRTMLGMRIDCLQCHDDFLGNVTLGEQGDRRSGRQQDFHQLAAFFTAAQNGGLQGLRGGRADYQFQYLDAEQEVAVEPAVPFAPELLPPRGKGKQDERKRLAAWLTDWRNQQFSRAVVVRVWTLMFGRPPGGGAVDDLPLDAPVDPVVAALAEAFTAGGMDLRQLIRSISDLDAFRVDSRAGFEIGEAHQAAQAVFPLTRLRAEQVAGAALQSARIKTIDRQSSFASQMEQYGRINDFLKAYGDLGEDEFIGGDDTVPQRLVMLNGQLVNELAGKNPVTNACSHVAMFCDGDAESIETMYLSILNRLPTPREQTVWNEQLADESVSRNQVLQDLAWVLMGSSEFGWNH